MVATVRREVQTRGQGDAHDVTDVVGSALLGPSLTIPVVAGTLTLGTWQQVMLLELDTRGRRRELVIQIVGD